MLEKKPKSLNLILDFEKLIKPPDHSQEDDLNMPLEISTNNLKAFFRHFLKIFESIKFAAPPEIFQFYRLISEDQSQITINNIKKYDIISLLLNLLSMSTIAPVIKASLKIICLFINCSDLLFIDLIQNNLLDILPQIYSYPLPKVQNIISELYVIITDLDRTSVPIILKCTSDFIIQSVQWAACHNIQNCREKCLLFQYNIIIGSDHNLPMQLIYHLSRSLLSILVCGNISLISYSAWTICRLIQDYGLTLDLKDVFNCLFSSVQNQYLFESEASIPILRMIVKTLRRTKEFQSLNYLLPIINWQIMMKKMTSDDHEISYLFCRICQYLINIGIECIDIVLSKGILDIISLVYEDCPFKSMCEVSILLKNIWINGNINQKKIIFCHRCFLLFLKFIEGQEMDNLSDCFRAMYIALKSVTDIEKSFIPQFLKFVPSYFFTELVDHPNDDINQLAQIISETFYPTTNS